MKGKEVTAKVFVVVVDGVLSREGVRVALRQTIVWGKRVQRDLESLG
jgi:hypothetical protein